MQREMIHCLSKNATRVKDISETEELRSLEITRRNATKDQTVEVYRFHVFADASPTAYGAAGYLVVLYNDGTGESSLVTAKSRVAPIKRSSSTRLELMAAVAAATLSDYVTRHFTEAIQEEACRTGGIVVLHWIQGASNWDVFVANRVAEILQKTAQES